MDKRTKLAFYFLGGAVSLLTYKVIDLNNTLNLTAKAVLKLINIEHQKNVDAVFEEIIEDFDR